MGHGFGVTEFVNGNAPDAVVVLFAVLTQLGDLWFYLVGLSTLYFFAGRLPRLEGVVDRRRAAYLVALALGAVAVVTVLKAAFAHPRPPGAETAEAAGLFPAAVRPIYESMATGDGFALPSGHATGAAVIYGGAATVLVLGTRRERYAAAALVVAVVALSRVVIGVHYLGDVVGGVVAGGVYLVFADRLSDRGSNPGRAFSLAALVAASGVLVAGVEPEPMVVLGAALGARVAWGALGEDLVALPATRRAGAVGLAVGLPVFGGLFAATYALEPAPPLSFLGGTVSIGGLLVTPLLLAALPGLYPASASEPAS